MIRLETPNPTAEPDDFPEGCLVRLPTGKRGRVIGVTKGGSLDRRQRMIVEYLDGGRVTLPPQYLIKLRHGKDEVVVEDA